MTTLALKKQIVKDIDSIEDTTFLKAVYAIIHDKAKDSIFEFSDELKTMLDERKERHQKGLSKGYTVSEARKQILAQRKK